MIIPSLDQIGQLLTSIKAAASTITSKSSSLGDKLLSAIPVATQLAGDIFPGATIAGITVAKVLSLATGLSNAEPEIAAAVGNLEAVVGAGAVSDADWATFNAAADKAHNDFQAAVSAYVNG